MALFSEKWPHLRQERQVHRPELGLRPVRLTRSGVIWGPGQGVTASASHGSAMFPVREGLLDVAVQGGSS